MCFLCHTHMDCIRVSLNLYSSSNKLCFKIVSVSNMGNGDEDVISLGLFSPKKGFANR